MDATRLIDKRAARAVRRNWGHDNDVVEKGEKKKKKQDNLSNSLAAAEGLGLLEPECALDRGVAPGLPLLIAGSGGVAAAE
jgi:hypothetical protein